MEELLNEIDELLSHFEDFTHGKDGEHITKMRGKIALALRQYNVSGSANDFEKELYQLINRYVTVGLSKTDLVHKMQYVTKSCEVS